MTEQPETERQTETGWVAPAVREEFPGLGIIWTEATGPSGRSPEPVRERLRELSDRFLGGHAVQMRQRPIPWAYRVFFRQIGLDPDTTRTPIEQLALERMQHGNFRSRNQLDDAITIATVETGVGLHAFDAEEVDGPLGIRASAPGEALEGRPGELPHGTLVVADAERPLSLLFGAMAAGRGVDPETQRILIAAVQVRGVPRIAIDEALWIACAAMDIGR